MNVLIIPEDFRKDQYIVGPIIRRMCEEDLHRRSNGSPSAAFRDRGTKKSVNKFNRSFRRPIFNGQSGHLPEVARVPAEQSRITD